MIRRFFLAILISGHIFSVLGTGIELNPETFHQIQDNINGRLSLCTQYSKLWLKLKPKVDHSKETPNFGKGSTSDQNKDEPKIDDVEETPNFGKTSTSADQNKDDKVADVISENYPKLNLDTSIENEAKHEIAEGLTSTITLENLDTSIEKETKHEITEGSTSTIPPEKKENIGKLPDEIKELQKFETKKKLNIEEVLSAVFERITAIDLNISSIGCCIYYTKAVKKPETVQKCLKMVRYLSKYNQTFDAEMFHKQLKVDKKESKKVEETSTTTTSGGDTKTEAATTSSVPGEETLTTAPSEEDTKRDAATTSSVPGEETLTTAPSVGDTKKEAATTTVPGEETLTTAPSEGDTKREAGTTSSVPGEETLITAASEGDTKKKAPKERFTVKNIVTKTQELLGRLGQMNQLVLETADSEFKDLFLKLQNLIDVLKKDSTYPNLDVKLGENGIVLKQTYHNDLLRKLFQFFGMRYTRVKDYFNAFFGSAEKGIQIADLLPRVVLTENLWTIITKKSDLIDESKDVLSNVEVILQWEKQVFQVAVNYMPTSDKYKIAFDRKWKAIYNAKGLSDYTLKFITDPDNLPK